MDNEVIRTAIVEFVRGVDGVVDEVSTTASFEELGVDSMSTMDLLVKVEKEFGVDVPDDQLPMITNIQDLVNFVSSTKQEANR